MHPRRARPGEIQRLELLAQLQDPRLSYGEGVVIKEYLVYIREQLQRMLHFCGYIVCRPRSPRMPVKRLRPQAECAQRRAPSSCVEGYVWMQKKWYVIPRHVEVSFVYGRHPGQLIQILDLRSWRVVHDAAILAITYSLDLVQRPTGGKLGYRIIELLVCYEVYCAARIQTRLGKRCHMRSDKRNLE